jgi:hypothetical protein
MHLVRPAPAGAIREPSLPIRRVQTRAIADEDRGFFPMAGAKARAAPRAAGVARSKMAGFAEDSRE